MSAHRPLPDVQELLGHAAWLRRLVAPLLGDEHDVEDVLQETWLAALERPLREASRAGSFLAGIASRCAQRVRRSAVRRRQREERVARPEHTLPVDELVASVEIEARLAVGVLALPAKQRDALLLRFYADLPPRAIARELQAPVATVKTWIRRGLERLASELERELGPAWRGALAPLALPPIAATPVAVGGGSSVLLCCGVAMQTKLALGVVSALALAGWLWFADGTHAPRDAADPTEALAPTREEQPSGDGASIPATVLRDAPLPAPAPSSDMPTTEPAPPRALLVEVVDVHGTRVPEAVLELALAIRRDGGETTSGYGTYRSPSDDPAEPIAIDAEDLAEVFAARRSHGEASQVVLEVQLIGLDAVRRFLESEELPREPLRIQVPPVGRAIVELYDREGRPFLEEALVQLRAAPLEMPLGDEEIWRRIPGAILPVSGGRALFACVGLGRHLRASARDRHERFVTSHIVARGPQLAGEEVTLRVELRDPLPHLVGRCVDESGAPLVRRRVSWFAERGGGRFGSETTTDAEGFFELPWSEHLRRGAPHDALVFHLGDPRDPTSATVLRPAPAVPATGRLDLGTLILREPLEPQVLAAGTIVDAEGRPLPDVQVVALAIWPLRNEGPHEELRELRCEGSRTGPDGAFRLLGTDLCRGLKLEARLDGHYQDGACLAERGRLDLRLVLQRGAAIRGNVLLDPGVPPGLVHAEFRSAKDRPLASTPVRIDGRFELRGLRQERGRLVLRRDGLVLASLDDISPASDEDSRDPRLVDLDLRARLRELRLRAVDASGAAITRASFLELGGSNGLLTAPLDPAGRVHTWIPRELEEIEIGIRGFAPRRIAWSAEEQHVRFEAPLLVHLRLAPAPSLPESFVFEVATRAPEDASFSALERRLAYMAPERLAPSGELRCPLPRAGRYALHLWLSDPLAQRTEYLGERALEVDARPGARDVLVALDPQELEAALAKLR